MKEKPRLTVTEMLDEMDRRFGPLDDDATIGVGADHAARLDHGGEDRGGADGLGEWDAGDDVDLPPPRGWLLGNKFCRNFLSSLLGDGGVGKTALRILQLLSLATGRPLTGEHVFQRCRVLIVSLEDDARELRRRVLAARLHYGISLDDVKGWLFLSTPGRAAGKLMASEKGGRLVPGAMGTNIEAVVVKRKIDLVSLDPFVKAHAVDENSNNGIDSVVEILTEMSGKYDISIDTPHHTSKGPSDPGNADRGRGANSMKNGGRLVYTAMVMSVEEARLFGIPEEKRKSYFRVDSGKVNITPPSGKAQWFHLIGVPLGNATDMYPNGDEVQTVEPWTPPDTWEGLGNDLLNRILDDLDAGMPDGERYSDAGAAKDRAAWRVVAAHADAKTEGQCRDVIKAWKKTGLLFAADYDSKAERKTLKGLFVDATKRPGTVS